MFPLSALLAHAELRTRAKRPPAAEAEPGEARRAVRTTRYGNLTLYPRVEQGELVDALDTATPAGLPADVIDATWDEPRVVATLSNVSTSGVGLILNEELPAGLEFDVHWVEGERPGPVRFEVVHTRPLSAGLYRTGARLVAGELPAEPVPTPFVRRFELATADPSEPADVAPALAPAAVAADDVAARAEPPSATGVMRFVPRPAGPSLAAAHPAPAGTFKASAAAGFEKTERLDGVTTCGWERSVELRRDGDRLWLYIHSPGKKNGWGIFVDPGAFEAALGRVQDAAGSPFVATAMAA